MFYRIYFYILFLGILNFTRILNLLGNYYSLIYIEGEIRKHTGKSNWNSFTYLPSLIKVIFQDKD